MKSKKWIYLIGIFTIGLFLFIVFGNEKEMVIYEELLNSSEIEYLEVVGIDNEPIIIIEDEGDIERIIVLLKQLNGSLELEYLPSEESLLGLNVVLKGHYPSAPIIIYQDKIFHGKGRNVPRDIVNELVKTIENSI
ncbi:hypothetical protein SAMN05518871_104151 [Psychrobacillus sp. OK028]|uniref:hypothetical protein n=1 Tax=Psychrobacillus sp. OK028 TaxID=1884359 RepID=UPI000889BBCE|nr:hypothetical protein [Psychrobacillus sp. OK028]SDN27844.1 hypothetical protein SAMN05518871_104151 [Psychrobacillus sp. OK028]